MAPELLVGTKCTQAVDIYSFGILLWELCTGCHPVRGRVLQLQVPRDCPQAVADLYEECTAADPGARPTARELLQRLRQLRKLHRVVPVLQHQGAGAGACTGTAITSTPSQPGIHGAPVQPHVQKPSETKVVVRSIVPAVRQLASPFAALKPSFLRLSELQAGCLDEERRNVA